MQNFSPAIARHVAELPEIGSQKPGALKAGRYSNNLTLNKVWIDTNPLLGAGKQSGPLRAAPVNNQFNFRGECLVAVEEYVKESRGRLKKVFIVHGELKESEELGKSLRSLNIKFAIPKKDEVVYLRAASETR